MIFVSHSSLNKPSARKVVEALATERLPCWLDDQQLDVGAELRASLRSAISESDVYLYLVSEAANESQWVQDELKYALGLEHEGKLRIVPVRLSDKEDALPPLLSGRLQSSLDPTSGGAARLAYSLTELSGHDRVPENCRLSATVRIEEHRLVHSLAQARELSAGQDIEIHVLLLDGQYEGLDSLYWNVAEVDLPPVTGSPQMLTSATQSLASIHSQSRRIIKEVPSIGRRFLATDIADDIRYYLDAGHERLLRVLLHRLQ